jgi:hypothetical protein
MFLLLSVICALSLSLLDPACGANVLGEMAASPITTDIPTALNVTITPRLYLAVGEDFTLTWRMDHHLLQDKDKDWIALYQVGQSDACPHWKKDRYYCMRNAAQIDSSNVYQLVWKGMYGPWQSGVYEFRYFHNSDSKV